MVASILLLTIFLILSDIAFASDQSSLIILRPNLDGPYTNLFDNIVNGVQKGFNDSDRLQIIQTENNSAKPLEKVNASQDDFILLLTPKLLEEVTKKYPNNQIAIAITTQKFSAPNVSSFMLIPNPDVVFKKLSKFSVTTKRIYMILHLKSMQWLADAAQAAAKTHNYDLQIINTEGLSESALAYRNIIKGMDPKTDAIWVTQDNMTMDARVILPFLLDRLWNDGLLMFSTVLVYVDRGMAFGAFPNNEMYGQQIGKQIKNLLDADQKLKPIYLLDTPDFAMNLRTTRHLKAQLYPNAEQQFNIFLPRDFR
ncbi:MAG: hypothetical protein V4629_05195 [Pseudomonadota bacterium]